jgi:hypothetical protein
MTAGQLTRMPQPSGRVSCACPRCAHPVSAQARGRTWPMCQLQERCTTRHTDAPHTYLPPGSPHGRAARAATDSNSLGRTNLSGNLARWHPMKLRLGGPPFDPRPATRRRLDGYGFLRCRQARVGPQARQGTAVGIRGASRAHLKPDCGGSSAHNGAWTLRSPTLAGLPPHRGRANCTQHAFAVVVLGHQS